MNKLISEVNEKAQTRNKIRIYVPLFPTYKKRKSEKNVEVLSVSRNKLQAILHKKQTFMIYSEAGRKNLPPNNNQKNENDNSKIYWSSSS